MPFFIDHIPGAQDINSRNFLPMEVWLMVHKELRTAFKKKWNAKLKVDYVVPMYIFRFSKPRISRPARTMIVVSTEGAEFTYEMFFSRDLSSSAAIRVSLVWRIFEGFNHTTREFFIQRMQFSMRVVNVLQLTTSHDTCLLPINPGERVQRTIRPI